MFTKQATLHYAATPRTQTNSQHTPNRELTTHTITLLTRSGYGGYLWTKVKIE